MNKILSLLFLSALFHSPIDAEDCRSISTVGTIFPQYKTPLGSIVSGRVDCVLVDVGDVVKKGEALIRLDTTFFTIALREAEAALASAKIERMDAERNFERMKKLYNKPEGQTPSISQKRFEDAKTRYDEAIIGEGRAEESAKRAKTNLKEATIVAPYDGIITRRCVHPGEAITATPITKLIEIMSIDSLYVEFSIPQLWLSKVHLGTPMTLHVEGDKGLQHSAKIDLIFPDVDERTRSIKCRTFLPKGSEQFHPGSLVTVHIPLDEVQDDPR
jgi:membrane fusion protein, multidrug efflux system